MGRSKFPGKPSKHTNRKRINVLPPTSEVIIESNNSVTVGTDTENKQVLNESNRENSNSSNNSLNSSKVSLRRRLNKKLQHSKSPKNNNTTTTTSNKRSLICNKNKMKNKSTKSKNITRNTTTVQQRYSNIKSIKKQYRKNKKNKSNKNKNNTPKETNNHVGKFVLPTRSVHSSRVIKPNKRFINFDLNESITLKKKVLNKRHCIKQNDDTNKTKNIKRTSENNINSPASSSTFSQNGRVVLRQARLKLHTQITTGPEGPFSSNSSNNSPSGTVTCGVCGAVRFYRFVKQARKFNIYSCESCRKFISKMIKRLSCKTNTILVCNEGQGMCHVPPIVRSQHWKLIRCAYRARCPACWLKMCLRSFQMPLTLKNNLIQLLPKNMQGPNVLFNNSLPLLWQKNVQNNENNLDSSNNKSIKLRPVRFKNTKPVTVLNLVNRNNIKRQKIDLKGPRVKHVCRSASIVLGQPLAIFNSNDKKIHENTNIMTVTENNNRTINDSHLQQLPEKLKRYEETNLSSSNENNILDIPTIATTLNDLTIPVITIRKDNRNNINKNNSFQPISAQSYNNNNNNNNEKKRNQIDLQNNILIDYWQNYDQDEIYQNGFCLIGSKQFLLNAVCFLCGSGSREPLLHCSLCCEPYHLFCLEQTPPSINQNKDFIWLCPRCTICSACNQTDRQKINCQKCTKSYHPECFNPKWSSINDRPTVCSQCLSCKSCGVKDISKFVGNMPLCLMCFKLRKKGNFCPICQCCYDGNDYCTKMMECTKCNKWVHANCESLSEDYYQILSHLPDSVEYLCSLCSGNSSPYWRKAVELELKNNFNHILRLLSKNKIAKNVLKWSPLSKHNTLNKTIISARKLQFSDDDDDDNNSVNSDLDNKIINTENNLENNNISESSTIDLNDNNESDIDIIINSKTTTTNNKISMFYIKQKLNMNEYCSIKQFNKEMEEALNCVQSDELLNIYHSILQLVFPWYDSNNIEIDSNLDTISNHDEIIEEEIITEKIIENELNDKDLRYCAFCKNFGDGYNYQESRLLYCGQNEWVHANCALWSSEVYEEIDGSLQNVHSAISRGRSIRCTICKQKGASVGCCYKSCHETYHFICARNAKCYFMHDKNVYCFNHDIPSNSNIIITPNDFDIRRSVYVELDKRKGKLSSIDKVNVMIGSLCVKNLGKINPTISDTSTIIIPTGYVCSRLYWSTIEPWKMVVYTITTSILNFNSNTSYVDRNFTIDHTLPKFLLDQKLKELYIWQKELDKKLLTNDNIINEFNDDDDDEPQNGAADLLSPEITDAIFEELPRELLDDISVEDIFPKFLSYEDFIDCKNDNSNSIVDSISNINDMIINKNDDIIYDNNLNNNRSLKRNKTDLNVDNNLKNKKSCNVTLSCKLDNRFSPPLKKRKLSPRDNNLFFQLLQVDGNFDDSSSSGSECSSPVDLNKTNTWCILEEPVTCENCQCTYRTQASFKRHLETCEIICTSESDSEINQDNEITTINSADLEITSQTNNINIVDNSPVIVDNSQQPVLLTTSYESYQNQYHTSVLNSQTFVTSKSQTTSELITVPQNSTTTTEFIIPQLSEQKSIVSNIPVNTVAPLTINQETIINENNTQQQSNLNNTIITNNQPTTTTTQFCVNQSVPLCVNPSILQPNVISVNPTQINPVINQGITVNQPSIEFQTPSITIQSVPLLNVTPQNHQLTLNGKLLTNSSNLMNSVITQGISTNQWMKPITTKPAILQTQKTMKLNKINKGRSLAAKRTSKLQLCENETVIIPNNTTTTTTAPQVIVQHLPSTNFIPTFVDTFQQQSTQNLQYLTTLTPQTHHQPLVQIQPTDNNLISLLQQPTTVFLQPQPTRIVENQLVLDSNGSLSWTSSPTTTVHPIYYGFETIVQNTVMQSQQFLPTTVPGILTANSSYSTTTQVFQSSKLEPVLDVTPNSFVLLNPTQLVNSQPVIEVSQNATTTTTPQTPQQPQTQLLTTSNNNNNTMTTTIIDNIVQTNNDNNIRKLSSNSNNKYSNSSLSNIIVSTVPTSSSTTSSSQFINGNNINNNNNTTNSITLPTAPFLSEQKIPTNIVIPTPKPPTSNQTRPMSRVLPMPTSKDINKKLEIESQKIIENEIKINLQPKFINDTMTDYDNFIEKPIQLPPIQNNNNENVTKTCDNNRNNESSLKLIFQKQNQEGVYKLSNNFALKNISPSQDNIVNNTINDNLINNKNNLSNQDKIGKLNNNFVTNKNSPQIQIAPLKPIKSKPSVQNLPPSPLPSIPSSPVVDKIDEIMSEKNDAIKSLLIELPPTMTAATTTNNNKYLPQKNTHIITNNNNNRKQNLENMPSILYTIETRDGFKYSSTSITDLWNKVFETVQNVRAAHNMPLLPENVWNLNSIQLLGLNTNSLKYLIEQLPSASKCIKYKPTFNFHKMSSEMDDDCVIHGYGSVRCAPNVKRNEPYDMFSWLASKHRKLESPKKPQTQNSDLATRRNSVNNLPMAMRFRQLKLTYKKSVGVYRSKIHRRGLFCLRNFEAGEMVIEYSGEVIRSVLTDKREKLYNSKGIGCYMFRIDDNLVVDATMKGNAARFINHSCDPNCYSKVVEILGHKHIIIFALRSIKHGEELTYDYKFPIEEDKIPCTCGARKCRKFLN